MVEPMPEQLRMEAFYEKRLPSWMTAEKPFAKDGKGQYVSEFGALCWDAWQAAQYAVGAPRMGNTYPKSRRNRKKAPIQLEIDL
jgi:hypothetical protein